MSGLREALEDMCVKADRRDAVRRGPGARPVPALVGVDAIRSLLFVHPAESSSVDRDALALVIREHVWDSLEGRCSCGDRVDRMSDHIADAVLALINGSAS